MFSDLVKKNRSYRRFKQTPALSRKDLEDLVEVARISSSGGNIQPLAYYLSSEPSTAEKIFGTLHWAGYLTDWSGPEKNERPTSYIVILRNNELTTNFTIDHGIAAENIRLSAAERGFGSCIIGSIDRKKLREVLELPNIYEILLVVALGAPGETVQLETAANGDIKYWRDDKGVHHVPKRALKDVIIN